MIDKINGLTFVCLFKHVNAADGFIDSNGSMVKLTASDKIIWLTLYDRFVYFKNESKEYFESMKSLSEQTAISTGTISKSIRKFESAGVIRLGKVKGKYHQDKNVYKYMDVLDTYRVDGDELIYLYREECKTKVKKPKENKSSQDSSEPPPCDYDDSMYNIKYTEQEDDGSDLIPF